MIRLDLRESATTREWIYFFQRDNDPSKRTPKSFRETPQRAARRPSESPDLDPIEDWRLDSRRAFHAPIPEQPDGAPAGSHHSVQIWTLTKLRNAELEGANIYAIIYFSF